MADLSVDITKLPDEIRDKLAELDLELSEGRANGASRIRDRYYFYFL